MKSTKQPVLSSGHEIDAYCPLLSESNHPVSFSESATQEVDYTYTIQRILVNTLTRQIPRAWYVAILGTVAALPATIVINWLPDSEATVGGGVTLVGAMIAGAIAANRSVEPGAAGLRAGFLGGMIAISVFSLTEATTVPWSLSTIAFFLIACATFLSLSSVFGLISGRIGGWVATSVAGFRLDKAP